MNWYETLGIVLQGLIYFIAAAAAGTLMFLCGYYFGIMIGKQLPREERKRKILERPEIVK